MWGNYYYYYYYYYYKLWVTACTSDYTKPRCKLCMKDFDISNTGEAALQVRNASTETEINVSCRESAINNIVFFIDEHR